jgi:hypothetical protein
MMLKQFLPLNITKWQGLLLVAIATMLWACGGSPAPANDTANTTAENTTADVTANTPDEADIATAAPKMHSCQIAGAIMDNNQHYMPALDLYVCIKADSTTLDPDYGESHRIFEVYDTKTCDPVLRKVLPVNESPDFPYYISAVELNSTPHILIRGQRNFYSFNTEDMSLSQAMAPKFREERLGEDAQSGTLRSFTTWNNYLIGLTRDYGAFAFDMTDKNAPKAVEGFAEYQGPDDQYHVLFLLPADENSTQVLMPSYNRDAKQLEANPMLQTPMAVSQNVPNNARNNRFLVLRATDGERTPIAIDLEQEKRLEVPADIRGKQTQEILKWMRDGQ